MTLQTNPAQSISCYSISGRLSPYDLYTYIPCNLTAIENSQHSACCAVGDKCLTNGLCEYGGQNPNKANEFWRVACTDETFRDSACPKQCKDVEPDDPHLPNHLVFQCPGDGKWCCATGYLEHYPKRGTLNTTCCSISDLAFQEKEQAEIYTTAQIRLDIKTKTTTAASESETGTSQSSSTSGDNLDASATIPTFATNAAETVSIETAPPSSHNGSSKDLALGLGFGLGIPSTVLFVIGLLFIFLRLRRSWQDKKVDILGVNGLSQEDLRRTHPHAFYPEISSKELAVELDGLRSPAEVWTPIEKSNEYGSERGRSRTRVGADVYR